MPRDEEKVINLISQGKKITGEAIAASAGTVIGGLIGGPGGAAFGAGVTPIISTTVKLFIDFAHRSLSEREEVKVGGTAEWAIIKITERLNSGSVPRDDGFWQAQNNKRASAEEIFEGTLLKSKNEHEEKKAELYANIFVNTAFNSAISVSEANFILRVAGDLTYTQMCILSLIERKTQNQEFNLRKHDYEQLKSVFYETMSILLEIHLLHNLGFILQKDAGSIESIALLSWGYIVPNDLFLTLLGRRYSILMGLQDISEEDIENVAKFLRNA